MQVEHLQIWILVGALTVMGFIFGFVMKVIIGGFIKRMDEIVSEIKELVISSKMQQKDLDYTKDRLDKHEAKIERLESSSGCPIVNKQFQNQV